MSAPITLPPLDAQVLAELRQRYDETSEAETRTRYQMILLAQRGYTALRLHTSCSGVRIPLRGCSNGS